MKIRKAVIPAAGLGTRFLPATKAVPKELFPLIDKPLLQYAVEEAIAAGCTDVAIVLSRGKDAIPNYFDEAPEIRRSLVEKGKTDLVKLLDSSHPDCTLIYVRQGSPKGLGDAVLQARSFVGQEPFAVILPDDLIDSNVPCLKQMVERFEGVHESLVAITEVPREEISSYGCLDPASHGVHSGLITMRNIVEKPSPEIAPSRLAVIGRYILTPRIFTLLQACSAGVGGEVQLTDAIRGLIQHENVHGFVFEGERYDAGDKLGMLKASVAYGCKHPVLGPPLAAWLTSYARRDQPSYGELG